jgi:two-component system OmpR family response regulator
MPQPVSVPVQQVLIVDDDAVLRSEIGQYLAGYGYRAHLAADALEMDRVLGSTPIDVMILDLMLPGEDGLSICRRMADRPGPGIIIVSARGDQLDRVLGLELGADDYLPKPCAPRELLARVRSVLRRQAGARGERRRQASFTFAGIVLDKARSQLQAPNGAAIMLSPGELGLLQIFLERPRQILSRNDLIKLLRGDIEAGRAVEVQMSRLRRKMKGACEHELIKTIRGAGYILDADVSPL